MFGETTAPNLWPHVCLHHTTILIFLLFVFFQRLPLNRVPRSFLGNIPHVLTVGWFRHCCMQTFGRDGQKEWQGWLCDHGGWRRGRVSHWAWHHNKISDDQSRAVSAGGSRSVFYLSISPHFSFRHHLLFVSVSTERLRADRVRFARPERKRQPGRDANSPGIPMRKQKNVPSRVEGRFPKQVFRSTCCLLKSRPRTESAVSKQWMMLMHTMTQVKGQAGLSE